jgi:hypothetical protein
VSLHSEDGRGRNPCQLLKESKGRKIIIKIIKRRYRHSRDERVILVGGSTVKLGLFFSSKIQRGNYSISDNYLSKIISFKQSCI